MCPETVAISWSNPERYEPYLGRWSRLVGYDFVRWIDVPEGARWIEPGCGTGALTSEILAYASPASVHATDPSEQYLEHAREVIDDPAVSFARGRAEQLDAPDSSADAVVSGFVLNFLADPAAALSEAARVTRPGGVVAAYIWDYSGEMWAIRHFWDTAILLDPVARRLHEGRRFATWMPEELARRFREAGLVDVAVTPIVIDTTFRDFDDYWLPMLGQQGSAPSYLATLEPAAVETLRRAVHKTMPIAPDGSIPLTARAWAVKAIVPEDPSAVAGGVS